jgi:hypothetical protein
MSIVGILKNKFRKIRQTRAIAKDYYASMAKRSLEELPILAVTSIEIKEGTAKEVLGQDARIYATTRKVLQTDKDDVGETLDQLQHLTLLDKSVPFLNDFHSYRANKEGFFQIVLRSYFSEGKKGHHKTHHKKMLRIARTGAEQFRRIIYEEVEVDEGLQPSIFDSFEKLNNPE